MPHDTELWRQACASVCYPAFYAGMALSFAPSAMLGAWAMGWLEQSRQRRIKAQAQARKLRHEHIEQWARETGARIGVMPCYYCGEAHEHVDCPHEQPTRNGG